MSHNGVCLTVEETREGIHRVTAIDETLQKTNLGGWQTGTRVNIERSLLVNSRLDGHFVQGHVDATGLCKKMTDKEGSWELEFEYPRDFAPLIIEKGSICVNGISLTAFRVKKKSFSVAIVPFTFERTNVNKLKTGDAVNLEFDLLGKYLLRHESLNGR